MKQGALVRMPRADQWADRICIQLGKTVESILEVGRLLLKAKSALPHGEWGRLFDDHLVPFSQSAANQLMVIARHPILSNSEYVTNLPPAWGTLYELSQAESVILKKALREGIIRPDMKRRDVKSLLPTSTRLARSPHRSESADPLNARTPVGRAYFQITRVLSDQFDALVGTDQDALLALLDQTLSELRQRQRQTSEGTQQ